MPFLGFANFYHCFIAGFAKIAHPLNNLTKKDVPWHWTFVERRAFQALKDVFISKPILAQWDPVCPMRIETDVSNHTTAGVISQLGDDSKWHPVAYRSESMIDAERNYEIYNKELLVVIRALEEWQHFLEGLPEPFEIITNHTNLKYWTTARDLTRCQARWALWLSKFNFHLMHKPSMSNVLADALSCLPGSEVHDSDDNHRVTVLKPEYFRDIAAAHLISTDSFESLIRSHKDKDPEVLDALKGKAKELPNGELEQEEVDRLVYHHGCLYIPPDLGLCQEAMRRCHDAPAVGHPGQNQMLEEVLHYYWWPGVEKFMCKYVTGCETCAQGKPATHPRGPLQPLDVPDGPWQVIGVDLVGPLPLLG
jgi:hypothetical protein